MVKKNAPSRRLIIITDLDGTLLHPRTYSFEEAGPALELIRQKEVPLVICSSKTRAEIEVYRKRLDNGHPFISENGGGIFIPEGYFPFPVEGGVQNGYHVISLGMPYAEIRRQFSALREQIGVQARGFGDMTPAEIAALTGLSRDEAMLAKQRDFDEPFVFEGTPDERFFQAIEGAGLRWTQGRYFHLMGNHHKGRAVNLLKKLFERQYKNVVTVGLGDSLNDFPFLLAVDHPVLLRRADGSHDPRITMSGLYRTEGIGPDGWNEAVLALLARDAAADLMKKMVNVNDMNNTILIDIYNAALAAVDPYDAVMKAMRLGASKIYAAGGTYDLDIFNRILVVGAGKATARMALAIEDLLGERISEGLIIVKEGHTAPLRIIEQVEASHPIPNESGVRGTMRMMDLVRSADERTLVVCLFSGGASALLVAPMEGLTLRDKQEVTTLLLKAGATIEELNAVRKHLSAVKGGRFAKAACPAQIVALILSDVIGDRLDVIASGPTARDMTTYAEAAVVIDKYGLKGSVPFRVTAFLERGIAGQEPETVKSGDSCLHKTRNVIIGGIDHALAAAKDKALQLGFVVDVITEELQGEARDAARFLARTALKTRDGLKPGESRCLLSGGETTVTVRGNGKGGRNQELALAFAIEMAGTPGITLISAGTDGTDGPTDAAGAIVDGATAQRARELGVHPESYLGNNDSYGFFSRLDALDNVKHLLVTGPTGTNVMDIQILMIER